MYDWWNNREVQMKIIGTFFDEIVLRIDYNYDVELNTDLAYLLEKTDLSTNDCTQFIDWV